MIAIGQYNLLEVARSTPHGLFLEDKEGNSVLLPGKFIPEGVAVGDMLEVYVYKDNNDRPIATTQEPAFTLYECAFLKVSDINAHGAFVNYGVDKELLVPFREQKEPMQLGKSYLVYLYLDGQTDRLTGSTKIAQFLDDDPEGLEEGEEVLITVWKTSELGINVIVNNTYKGLLYHNEVFQPLQIGDRLTAYIAQIRPDGKLDIRLDKDGYSKVEPNAQKILDLLKRRAGFISLTDKSSPEQIKEQLGMSKKTFKKAVGSLYKQKRIQLEDKGIRLLR
jgi:predicted RNA-binding protein (virulence factor B family)